MSYQQSAPLKTGLTGQKEGKYWDISVFADMELKNGTVRAKMGRIVTLCQTDLLLLSLYCHAG